MLPLVVAGAGGFGRETVEAVIAINDVEPIWELLGFVDDDPQLAGASVNGMPVLGCIDALSAMPAAQVVVCTGHPGNYFSRKRIVRRLGLPPARYATIVHPAAAIAKSAELGPGTVVLAGAVATASVRVGAHVAAMPHVVLTHDSVLGDFVTLASGVKLGGNVTVEEGAYLGAGAMVREGRSVGPWALIGMGAVVTQNVPRQEVWAGVPARHIRDVDVPADLAGAA